MLTETCIRKAVITLALAASPLYAQLDPTDVLFGDPAEVDTAEWYKNTGFVNTSRAHDGAPMKGEMKEIPGVNWTFFVGFSADKIHDNGLADEATLRLSGSHDTAPHGGDAPSNGLPEISTKTIDIAKGVTKKGLAVWGGDVHPGVHMDYYGVKADVKNITQGAVTSLSTANCVVAARHAQQALVSDNADPYSIPKDLFTMGSDKLLVSYDAPSRTLTFGPCFVNIMDSVGGSSFGVDPDFGDDPLLNGLILLQPVQVADAPNEDGTFSTTPGAADIVGPDDLYAFSAQFDELRLAPMTPPDLVGSAGILKTGTVIAGEDDKQSQFLQLFTDANVVGVEVPEWDRRATVVSLVPLEVSLLDVTDGFSQSCANVPFAVTFGGTQPFGADDHGCVADFNGDGLLSLLDFFAFRQAWAAKDPAADLNGDGLFTFEDYLAFRVLYSAGCD